MATIYFTNNADSGDGSLRAAWTSASAGDVIMADPNSFSGDTIEILLSANWSVRALELTLDGGVFRIILNGQNTHRVGTGTSASIVHTYRNVDFKNFSYTGTGSTAVQYPMYLSGFGSLTFTNCRFYGNHCASGATSNFMRTTSISGATLTFNNCLAYANGTNETGRFVQSGAGTFILNGCTFYSNVNGSFTNNDSLLASAVDFGLVDFVDILNNDFRLLPSSPYLTGGTLTGTDFLGHTRSGSKGAFDGSWLVVAANGSSTLSSNLSVDYCDIENGATITFSGTDRILAVTKGATIGTATFAASTGSNGYLATASISSSASATFSDVTPCEYGAEITAFSASESGGTVGFSITKTNNKQILLERNVGGSWQTVTDNATNSTTVSDVTTTTTFRVFDGVNFLTATVAVATVSPFWRILDWSVAGTSGGGSGSAWTVDAWAIQSSGGESDSPWFVSEYATNGTSGGGGETVWSVTAYAVDPEIEED